MKKWLRSVIAAAAALCLFPAAAVRAAETDSPLPMAVSSELTRTLGSSEYYIQALSPYHDDLQRTISTRYILLTEKAFYALNKLESLDDTRISYKLQKGGSSPCFSFTSRQRVTAADFPGLTNARLLVCAGDADAPLSYELTVDEFADPDILDEPTRLAKWFYDAFPLVMAHTELNDLRLNVSFSKNYKPVFERVFTQGCGDLDEDGRSDVHDAVLLARMAGEDPTLRLTDTGRANADINGDGAVDVSDLTLLLKLFVQ